jgi:ribose 1,5-bisphosphokinase
MNRESAFVAVVGPSGAGKDTLLAHARTAFAADPHFVFVRRVVTRPPGPFEDHDTMTEAEFARREAEGGFALSWRAHGLLYGVPLATLEAVKGGQLGVCNLSRGAIADARRRFPRVVTLLVTAPNATIAARLAARGRETPEESGRRLTRESALTQAIAADRVVSNDGTREEGARKFVLCLERIRAEVNASASETTNGRPAMARAATS